nr:unnamed protein product [Spirometra erinaceieuropaei]
MQPQGCVLAPTLFSLMFSPMQMGPYREERKGSEPPADGPSQGDMQRTTDLFDADYDNIGLVINTDRTVVMHRPPPDAAYVALKINVNDFQLQVVDNLTYPGSAVSCTTKIDHEVPTRPSAVCKAQTSITTVFTSTPH